MPSICILPLKREELSCALIGADWMWPSDWPGRVQPVNISGRSDRLDEKVKKNCGRA